MEHRTAQLCTFVEDEIENKVYSGRRGKRMTKRRKRNGRRRTKRRRRRRKKKE